MLYIYFVSQFCVLRNFYACKPDVPSLSQADILLIIYIVRPYSNPSNSLHIHVLGSLGNGKQSNKLF